MKLNQKGFGVVEGLLVVIALVLVGGVGYYVYGQNRDTNKTSNSSDSSTKTTQQGSSKGSKQETNKLSDEEAINYVKKFYDEYITSAAAPVDTFKKYGTDNFVNDTSNANYDPVLCGQQGKSQAQVSVSKPASDVTATITYPSGSKIDAKVKLVTSNEQLKIDSVTCQL